MKSFLAGFGIGLGVGILFAPLAGEETRDRLASRAGDFADSARGLVDEGRDCMRVTVSRLRKRAEEFGRRRPTGTESMRDLP